MQSAVERRMQVKFEIGTSVPNDLVNLIHSFIYPFPNGMTVLSPMKT